LDLSGKILIGQKAAGMVSVRRGQGLSLHWTGTDAARSKITEP